MQVDPTKYKNLIGSIKTIAGEEGTAALFKGWLPTLLGYSAQGCFKFGLYEFFKDYYATLAGEENAKKYQGLIWLAGSASAEFFADAALCPLEMVKVKVQTSTPDLPYRLPHRPRRYPKDSWNYLSLWPLVPVISPDPLHHGQVLLLREGEERLRECVHTD